MKQSIITLSGGVPHNPLVRFRVPANAEITAGGHVAIVGPNGAGKTLLVDMLMGKYMLKSGSLCYDFSPASSQAVYDQVKYVSFRDVYGAADVAYYQQRWNSADQEASPLVSELLGTLSDEQSGGKLFRLLGMERLMNKKVILLSSGELRKFQLFRALLSRPRVLILDNPFIGLDSDSRERIQELLTELSALEDLRIVLVLSIPSDVPEFITEVIPVEERTVGEKLSRANYFSETCFAPAIPAMNGLRERILGLPYRSEQAASGEVIRLKKVTIRYGERTILRDLDWSVRQEEKWALSGENGSGKSTLLSLICADNPQSYACDIRLFDRKRGTGESIWDIKERIGYVSPEMHRAYLKNISTIEIVASGLYDTIGLYKRPRPEQFILCEWWMDIFGIAELKERSFLQLSSGEQRLVLLARAFVKDPELLILDEPLHGLDTCNRLKVKYIIEAFCRRRGKTLIMVTHYQEELPDVITNTLRLTRQE